MSVTANAEISIRRTPQEVFDFLADFENNPGWQKGMKSCRFVTEPPLRVGSRYEQEASFLGRKIRSLFEVVELEPGRSITITTIESSFPITVTRSVEPDGEGGSRVRAEISGDATGFFRIARPLLARMVQRSVDRDYRVLKETPSGVLASSHSSDDQVDVRSTGPMRGLRSSSWWWITRRRR